MNQLTCYSAEQLRDYVLGRLDESTAGQVESHLRDCLACEETIALLDDTTDSLLRDLHQPRAPSQYAANAVFQAALEQVRRATWPPAPAATEAAPPEDGGPEGAVRRGVARLRDYQLIEPLGHGGMGTVFRAKHLRLQRDVAFKLLPDRRLRDDAAIARFQREMQAIGRMDHPAIVRAMDAGEINGQHFLAMEMIDGVDLGRLVGQLGPLSAAEACELIRQAALGLEYVHEHGIVHRDIKPSNLMLTRQGTVKILDLGLALLDGVHGAPDELTTVGQLMGTLDYMAPEQFQDSHDVDHRADLYGLGATLYKLLSGKAPYNGPRSRTPLQKLRAMATEAPTPLGEHCPQLDARLIELVHRALSADASERPTTAAALAEELVPWSVQADLKPLRAAIDQIPPAADAKEWIIPHSLTESSAIPSAAEELSNSTGEPATAGSGGRIRRWLIGLATFGAFALAGWAIWIKTDKGSLWIRTPENNVDVQVEQTDVGAPQPSSRDASEPRYEGRTFAEWEAVLRSELSLRQKGEAIRALVRLSDVHDEHGDERVARTILTSLSPIELEEENQRETLNDVLRDALQRLDAEALQKVTTELLRDGNESNRWVVLELFVRRMVAFTSKSPQDLADLQSALLEISHTDEPLLRAKAIRVMAEQSVSDLAIQRWTELLGDEDGTVRLTAAVALSLHSPNKAELAEPLREFLGVHRLSAAFDFQRFLPVHNAVLALSRLGADAAVAVRELVQLLESEHAALYQSTLRVRVGPRAIMGPLDQLLWNSSLEDLIIVALRNIGPAAKPAAPTLIEIWRRRLSGKLPVEEAPVTFVPLQVGDPQRVADALTAILGESWRELPEATEAWRDELPEATEAAPGSAEPTPATMFPSDAPGAPGSAGPPGGQPAPAPGATPWTELGETPGTPTEGLPGSGQPAVTGWLPDRASESPVYQGMALQSWLAQALRPEAPFDSRTVLAIRTLARAEDADIVRAAFDDWKRRAEQELSPSGLRKIVGVLGALGIGELSGEGAETIFHALRRQELSQLDMTPGREDSLSIHNETLALVDQVHEALKNLPREVVLPRIARELEQGGSFSRSFVLDWASELHAWQAELTEPSDLAKSLAEGLLAASKDAQPEVARWALQRLGHAAPYFPPAEPRLNEAFEDPALRGAAAWGLFLADHPPGAAGDRVSRATEMARSDDPRRVTIGTIGLMAIGQESLLLERLLDGAWSVEPPADGPWPRLEALRNLDLAGDRAQHAIDGLSDAATADNEQLSHALGETVARWQRLQGRKYRTPGGGMGGFF